MKRRSGEPSSTKQLYRAPKLKVHGDFRKLTAAKAGASADGTGKPKTKSSGAST